MTRTFLVELEVGDITDAQSIAEELNDSLVEDGFDVQSVKPWAAPVTDLAGGLAPGVSAEEPPTLLG